MRKHDSEKEFRRSIPGKFKVLASLCLVAAIGSLGWNLAFASAGFLAAPACDATTGATCRVVGIKTTLNSATLYWTEQRHNFSRSFCYGTGSPTKCAEVTSRAQGVKEQVVTGLTASTTYAYKFYGTYHNAVKSVVTGTFTTDGTMCGTTVLTTVEVAGVVLSASGDSLEHVVAVATLSSNGTVLGRDTTDRSGGYYFDLDPGTYHINLACPPFTPPPAYTANVILRKPMNVPDLVMEGAFQVGGTVVSENHADSLENVLVTVKNKSDNSAVTSTLTDFEGHFNLDLKSGNYLVTFAYSGKTMPIPLDLAVSKSLELPDVVFSATASALGYGPALWPGKSRRLRESEAVDPKGTVDAKGARLGKRPAHNLELFPGRK